MRDHTGCSIRLQKVKEANDQKLQGDRLYFIVRYSDLIVKLALYAGKPAPGSNERVSCPEGMEFKLFQTIIL